MKKKYLFKIGKFQIRSLGELIGFVFMICCFLLLASGMFFYFCFKSREQNEWYKDQTLIGHAFYGINGITYTNSYEALESGYQKGIRVMEVDFSFTSDERLVLVHDWYENTLFGGRTTYQEFMNSKVLEKYTPMDLSMLLSVMKKYTDLYIVIDSKEEFWSDYKLTSVYKEIVSECQKIDSSLLKRFIVQLYDFDDYQKIQEIYPFSSHIFSLYQMADISIKEIVYYCLWNKIEVIAVPSDFFDSKLLTSEELAFIQSKNLKIFVYTVNKKEEYEKFRKLGIDGVYTDYLENRNKATP